MSLYNSKFIENNCNDIDDKRKNRIINQLKNEVETLKARYILDGKSKLTNNTKQIQETNNYNKTYENFNHFTSTKNNEKVQRKYFIKNKNKEDNIEYKDQENEYIESNLEKNDSFIIEENHAKENINTYTISEENINNLYPKEYKRENLKLDRINNENDNELNHEISQIHNKKNKNFINHYHKEENFIKDTNSQSNNYMGQVNEKNPDYEMFDRAKENLIKIRNDLDELDNYNFNEKENKKRINYELSEEDEYIKKQK